MVSQTHIEFLTDVETTTYSIHLVCVSESTPTQGKKKQQQRFFFRIVGIGGLLARAALATHCHKQRVKNVQGEEKLYFFVCDFVVTQLQFQAQNKHFIVKCASLRWYENAKLSKL